MLFHGKIAGDSAFFGGLPDQSGGNPTLGWEQTFGSFLFVKTQRCQSEQPFKTQSFSPTLLTEACNKATKYPKIYREVSIYRTSSTAQGGGGSFKNKKPKGEVGCCESRMAERIH